ncbi:hypothetical protein NKI12_06025 [Mesorhizobium australicum]|uniref:Uncharacterized protein n=1 Tax=Mesorhizobium australicum TaxID=536018 RepID=A0ACC6SSP3_9HYPH|nr:hypothetical protein [Mesorhizobium sp. LNHC229A00]
MRGKLGKLVLSEHRSAVCNSFAHQALRDELSCLQSRQEDKRAEQEE